MRLYPILLLYLSMFVLSVCCSAKQKDRNNTTMVRQEDWKQKAKSMVQDQIRERGVSDPLVLEAMENTPRHLFVPENIAAYAYHDSPWPIGYGQTISQPYIVALMTELLDLQGNEKILEIGTGSGYQAAVLSPLVDTCYTIEVVRELALQAGERLARLGYDNVVCKWGDGYTGWEKYAPFDGIIITAAPPDIPGALLEQLRPGGRMVLPVGSYYQELILVTKTREGIKKRSIIPVRFVPMIHPGEPIPESKEEEGEK